MSDRIAAGVAWTQGTGLVTNLAAAGLWVAIAAGPVALGVVMLGRPASVPVVAPQLVADPQVEVARQRAEEFAVRVVTVWLGAHRGQEGLVGALLPQAAGLTLPQAGLSVTDPMVASSTSSGGGVWAVTVAAQVTDSRMSARRFFTVPIRVVGELVVAVALPSERPGSQVIAAGPELDYSVDVPAGSALMQVAADFLNALLAGRGDVQRLISPEAQVRPVMPAPFTTVKVIRVAVQQEIPVQPRDGVRLEVLVTATALVDVTQQVTVQYALTLAVRAGRWEVAAVRDIPLMSKVAGTAIPSASPAPAGSVSPSPSITKSSSAPPTRK